VSDRSNFHKTSHEFVGERMKVYSLMLAGIMILSTAALAGGGSWKLLTHHYDDTSSIAEYLSWRDCEYVRARLMGNHPYDLEAAHLNDEVKTAECFR
jgi:hypothetical protein